MKIKLAGFFVVELLIVLIIVAVLVLAFLPNLQTYVQQAKFTDVLTAANSLKSAVELCGLNPDPGATGFTGCNSGAHGIPAAVASGYGGYVDSTNVTNGVITITSTPVFGPAGNQAKTYIITPTLN